MIEELSSRQKLLLKEICDKSQNVHLFDRCEASSFSSEDVETICALVSNEMMMNGIDKNFEPSEYGKELESLIDMVNRGRLL
jgi:hypothetical protein